MNDRKQITSGGYAPRMIILLTLGAIGGVSATAVAQNAAKGHTILLDLLKADSTTAGLTCTAKDKAKACGSVFQTAPYLPAGHTATITIHDETANRDYDPIEGVDLIVLRVPFDPGEEMGGGGGPCYWVNFGLYVCPP